MRFLVLTALLAPLGSLAAADPGKPAATTSPSASQMHTDDCARATAQRKSCVIDMGKGEEIEGKGVGGDGSAVTFIDWGKAGSLVHLRRDFITEIIKSAEDL